jgi:lipid-binding SYLF domain-containing protein
MARQLALALLATGSLAWLPLAAESPSPVEDNLLRSATLIFQRAVGTPAAAIPASLMLRARALAVVPAAVKDGALYYGRGIVSARGASQDYWTPPAIVTFEGAIPVEVEADSLDFIIVAQTVRGLDYLTQERFRQPIPHAIVPGALGAETPVKINADLLAYMQFGDYFAGVTIDNWMVGEMKDGNAKLYGRPYSTDEIVRGDGFFHLRSAARLWRDALADYFRERS